MFGNTFQHIVGVPLVGTLGLNRNLNIMGTHEGCPYGKQFRILLQSDLFRHLNYLIINLRRQQYLLLNTSYLCSRYLFYTVTQKSLMVYAYRGDNRKFFITYIGCIKFPTKPCFKHHQITIFKDNKSQKRSVLKITQSITHLLT